MVLYRLNIAIRYRTGGLLASGTFLRHLHSSHMRLSDLPLEPLTLVCEFLNRVELRTTQECRSRKLHKIIKNVIAAERLRWRILRGRAARLLAVMRDTDRIQN